MAGQSDVPRPWDDQLESLESDGHVSLGAVKDAIMWLSEISGNRLMGCIIDVGSGPGYAACAFAEFFPDARITALDSTLPFLESAEQRARSLGVGDRVALCHGELESVIGDLAFADLIWASHVIHHLPDPLAALRLLGDRLADGGLLALAEGGLPVRVLPGGYGVGRPSMPARLDAAMSDYWAGEWDLTDQAVGGGRDWPLLLADAGLVPGASRTFVVEHRAPLDARVRRYIVDRYEGFREAVGDALDPEDAAGLDVLLDARDPRSFQQRPDLFLLTAQTVHTAFRA
ncbi:MAG: class I SAM-dependent methyltransferase [Acidimicrobiia bacterium]